MMPVASRKDTSTMGIRGRGTLELHVMDLAGYGAGLPDGGLRDGADPGQVKDSGAGSA